LLAIIQARFSSVRLPGKILRELQGKPLLVWTVQRLRSSLRVSDVVVATSDDSSDNQTQNVCERYGIRCFRGSLYDVYDRFYAVSKLFETKSFVRISGDSPMIDPFLVDVAIEKFQSGNFDLVTNIQRRTFPKGQSVEILNSATFEKVASVISDPLDKEHVTRFFYKNPGVFRISNIESEIAREHIQLSIDTEEDLSLMEKLLSLVEPHSVTWQELAEKFEMIHQKNF